MMRTETVQAGLAAHGKQGNATWQLSEVGDQQTCIEDRGARFTTHYSLLTDHYSLRRFLFRRRDKLRVRPLEVFDLIGVEMPDARRHFIYHVVVVRHQQHCAV